MELAKRYDPRIEEPRLQAWWKENGTFHFQPDSQRPIYAIDTPPPTVSGNLHLGHTYSYSQTDFIARFWRMNGRNVYYPMGFDDNGLPTERLVEKRRGLRATEIGRSAFITECLAVSEEAEKDYQALWQRLGLSVDWRYTYRTIDQRSRRISQLSFLDLYQKGLVYRQKSPSIWCPECRTAIAQADLDDLERETTFYTLAFQLEDGRTLPIATTRPELLPACVAVFVHPDDGRFHHLIGQQATVPHFGQRVPVLADPDADPTKGSGAVMCCTFGDQADVAWWRKHNLPLIEAIAHDGRLTAAANEFSGLQTAEARQQIVATLAAEGLLLGEEQIQQSVRVHERCDTPVEYLVTLQWFVRVLHERQRLLEAGEQLAWYPEHMGARYRQWVENLSWDWCISRQRFFGVTFPLWYCNACGDIMLADPDELPIDPTERPPSRPCSCGSTDFTPETDVMDTWATSSMSPQIAGRWLEDDALYQRLFPMQLRPQAHEIIRTWTFYTIVKSLYHFDKLPWDTVAISGWGIAAEGAGKISKSRGGGPMAPQAMIERYSADAVRYWAASTSLGKDAVINEEKIQAGNKLVTKLWNVARFSQRFLAGYQLPESPTRHSPLPTHQSSLSPADRWILARTQSLIGRATALFIANDYAGAKNETERFFWTDLADNYLEMAKKRLYDGGEAGESARFALYHALLSTIKLLAPILPHVTEAIYQGLFAEQEGIASIHCADWPEESERVRDMEAETLGQTLVEIATAVRRYKSENNLSLGAELERLQIGTADERLAQMLREAADDLTSITRARHIEVVPQPDSNTAEQAVNGAFELTIER